MAATESALVVLVPAAEPVVGTWRQALDPAARLGVPAHVTVLYPFVPPADIDDRTLAWIAALLVDEDPFELRLAAVGWFGDDVAYCVPDPADRLRRLTERVAGRWPEHPPYGGAFDEVVPHLTIGQGAPPADLRRAAADVEAHLPVAQPVDAVHLLTGSGEPGSWSVLRAFRLGAASSLSP